MDKRLILLFLPEEFAEPKLKAFKEQYGQSYELVYVDKETVTDEELYNACAIIGNPPVDKLFMCTSLEWLSLDFAGADRYIEAAKKLPGLKLTNASGAFGDTISEHMLSVTLSLLRRLYAYRDNQREHIWKDMGSEQSLRGKNVLVLGTGDIGSSYAKLLKVFNCKITGINRTGRKNDVFDNVDTIDNLDQYITDTDVIALALPKSEKTNKIIDKKLLSKMKNSAILINVGRGNCIDEDALADALNNDELFGAALDVFAEEPLTKSALWDAKNIIITPHISGKTYGHLETTVNKVLDICVENLYRYVEDRKLSNLVDLNEGY